MKTISLKNKQGVETLIFVKTFEDEILQQVKKVINFEPYQKSKVRVMPDAHVGKGCTIGTTMTISDKVTPNLVGVDIGCGMLTVKLEDKEIDLSKLDATIKAYIPSGFKAHEEVQSDFDFSTLHAKEHVDTERASLSIGSLGSGNHFIEIGKSENTGELHLIIHSGSRRLGTDVCNYYQKMAYTTILHDLLDGTTERMIAEGREKKDIMKEMKKIKKKGVDKELAFLEGGILEDYLYDMVLVQKYASANRATIANIIIDKMQLKEASRFETIHNYIDFERMILRKGAVSAEKDELLLIPLNMRDGSLLCVGKGNENWNYSAPHGAGRVMSRGEAKRQIDMQDFIHAMKNVYTTTAVAATIDEAPQAYKPSDEIMNAIADTADIIDVLKPIYNFKSK